MGVHISGNFTGTPDRPASPSPFTVDLGHFLTRILQGALTEATADYWERRAQAFEWSAPRPGDYRGHAPPDALTDLAIRCQQTADNCRHHAQLLREQPPNDPTAEDALA